jgi:hypothetical protein
VAAAAVAEAEAAAVAAAAAVVAVAVAVVAVAAAVVAVAAVAVAVAAAVAVVGAAAVPERLAEAPRAALARCSAHILVMSRRSCLPSLPALTERKTRPRRRVPTVDRPSARRTAPSSPLAA